MVKLIVRYDDHSTQVFIGNTAQDAIRRRREYEAKHPTLKAVWAKYE